MAESNRASAEGHGVSPEEAPRATSARSPSEGCGRLACGRGCGCDLRSLRAIAWRAGPRLAPRPWPPTRGLTPQEAIRSEGAFHRRAGSPPERRPRCGRRSLRPRRVSRGPRARGGRPDRRRPAPCHGRARARERPRGRRPAPARAPRTANSPPPVSEPRPDGQAPGRRTDRRIGRSPRSAAVRGVRRNRKAKRPSSTRGGPPASGFEYERMSAGRAVGPTATVASADSSADSSRQPERSAKTRVDDPYSDNFGGGAHPRGRSRVDRPPRRPRCAKWRVPALLAAPRGCCPVIRSGAFAPSISTVQAAAIGGAAVEVCALLVWADGAVVVGVKPLDLRVRG